MNKNETITFKELSHVTHNNVCPNDAIRKIEKGEEYESYLDSSYPKEDLVKRRFFRNNLCVAKDKRWRCLYNIYPTVESVIRAYHGRVMYNEKEDKWYYRAYAKLHFIDGTVETLYFNTNEELEEKIREITDYEQIKNIVL